MWDQRLIRFLKRSIFYMLLIPLLFGIVFTLSHELWAAALVLLVLCVLVLYKGLIRFRISANSLVVRDGKVVFFIPEETVRNRFDFVSRGQTIVELPHYGLLDRPYRLELYFPASDGRLQSCRLSLKLGYVMDPEGWQRAYDSFIRYQAQLSLVAKGELYKGAAGLTAEALPQGEEETEKRLGPIVEELNRGLANLGLKIVEATCTTAAAPTFARLVATEQETVEKL